MVDLSKGRNSGRRLLKVPAPRVGTQDTQLGAGDHQNLARLAAFLVDRLEKHDPFNKPWLRVAAEGDNAPGQWRSTKKSGYPYRCILPFEVVFDIGDGFEWPETRRRTHAICAELRELGVAHAIALSGGNGVHVHVLSSAADGVADGRRYFALLVKEGVCRRLELDPHEDDLDLRIWDPVCISPRTQLIREFGSRKREVKTLWCSWPEERWKPLPPTKAAAYNQAGVRIPERLPLNESLPGEYTTQMRAALGGMCPRTQRCVDLHRSGKGECVDCPLSW